MSNSFRKVLARIAVVCAFTTTVALAQDISVTKLAPQFASSGSDVGFQVTIANVGASAANGVSLTDAIPAGMTFVSTTQTSGPAFNCTNPPVGSGGTITCTIATLAAGASAGFQFLVNIPGATPPGVVFSNTATGAATPPDGNPGNDSSTATTTSTDPGADLAVTKTGPDTANAGTDVPYNVTLTNLGPDAAASVSLEDPVPPGMTFVSATQNSGPAFVCVDNQGIVTCSTATMLVGQTATFTFVFNIPLMTPPGTTFVNIATGSATNPDPNPENNSGVATTSTPPPPQADLGISKTGPASAPPNGNVAFSIVINNSGPDTADNVNWQDTLPGDLEFVSLVLNSGPVMACTTPAPGSGGTVNCSIATYAAGTTSSYTLTVHVPGSASSGTTYSNTATVTTSTQDPNGENNTSVASFTISSVDVSIVKTGPPTANAGTNVTYPITVSNAGPDIATNVIWTDPVPAGTTFVSLTQTGGPSASCTTPASGSTGTINCSILVFGLATMTFDLVLNTGTAVTINNTATVTTDNFDTNGANDTSTATTTVTQDANLAVTKTGPASVTAGNSITYTVTATNNGPSNATNVTLSDTLPPNTTFVSNTQNGGPGFSCTNPPSGGTGTINCTIATLAPGATATFTFVFNVSPAATGSIGNTANLSSSTPDSTPGNNTATANTNVTQSADVGVTKTGPPATAAGTTITYTVTATNSGPSNAATVTLTDVLPANTTFASNTQNSGPTFNCTNPPAGTAGTITCTIASFPAGTPATFTFVFNVSPAATGSINNTATISAASDSTPGNNSSSTSATTSQSADLTIVKAGPAAVTAGSNITYTITAANAGPANAANVTITDTLPANTTFVSNTQTGGPTFACSNPAVGAAGTITCTLASFAAGANATFAFVVNVPPSATGTVNNTASISSTTADPTPGNGSSNAGAVIDPGPTDLAIVKTANGTSFPQGSNVTYTLLVTNNGPGTAAGTTVTDILPPGTTLISANSTQGSCTGTATVTCNVGILAPSATATITLVVRLPVISGSVSNTATVTAVNSETSPANNASTAAVDVSPAIPTLSELALAALAILLGAAAMLAIRR